jgi:hypothetical protein
MMAPSESAQGVLANSKTVPTLLRISTAPIVRQEFLLQAATRFVRRHASGVAAAAEKSSYLSPATIFAQKKGFCLSAEPTPRRKKTREIRENL